jgi:hypothetical protein
MKTGVVQTGTIADTLLSILRCRLYFLPEHFLFVTVRKPGSRHPLSGWHEGVELANQDVAHAKIQPRLGPYDEKSKNSYPFRHPPQFHGCHLPTTALIAMPNPL